MKKYFHKGEVFHWLIVCSVVAMVLLVYVAGNVDSPNTHPITGFSLKTSSCEVLQDLYEEDFQCKEQQTQTCVHITRAYFSAGCRGNMEPR